MPRDSIIELLKLLFYEPPEPQMPDYAKSERLPFGAGSDTSAIHRAVMKKLNKDISQLGYSNDEEIELLGRSLQSDSKKAATYRPLPLVPDPKIPPPSAEMLPYYRRGAVDLLREFMHPDVFRNLPAPAHSWHPYRGHFIPPPIDEYDM